MATETARRGTQMMWAASLVSAAMLVSRLMGFVRNALIADFFGQTATVDQYNAAYVVPDTLYLLLIGGAISAAFVPVLTEYLSAGRRDDADRVMHAALTAVLVIIVPLIALGEWLAPVLVRIIAVGFDGHPRAIAETAYLTRIMLAAVLFHAVNGVLVGSQYARKSFWATAIGPLFYNIFIILVGALFGHIWGIQAFAWGVLIGAFVNFLVQIWGVRRLQYAYRWLLDFHDPGLSRIGRLMLPVVFGMGLSQLNLTLNQTFLASLLPAGGINALTLASRIMLTPVSLASSLAITLLPNLTELNAAGQHETFRQYLATALRVVIFLTVPATVGLLLLDRPLVAMMFHHGQFTSGDVTVTAGALTYYALGILAYGGVSVATQGFYAQKDTTTPVVIGIVVVVASFGLSWILLHPMAEEGLALAYSVAGWLNLTLLLIFLRRRTRGLDGPRVARTLVRSLLASGIMAIGVWLALIALGPWVSEGSTLTRLAGVTAAMGVGMVLYGLAARRLHMDEYAMVERRVLRRFRRA